MLTAIVQPVPHSVGLARPQPALPALAHWCAHDTALLHRVLVHNPARLYGFAT